LNGTVSEFKCALQREPVRSEERRAPRFPFPDRSNANPEKGTLRVAKRFLDRQRHGRNLRFELAVN